MAVSGKHLKRLMLGDGLDEVGVLEESRSLMPQVVKSQPLNARSLACFDERGGEGGLRTN